jgi:hypothetical protein
MKKGILATIICIITVNAIGQNYNSAIGVRFNSGSYFGGAGLSYKKFFNGNKAIDANVLFQNQIGIGAVLQIHKPLNNTALDWYYGAGGFVKFANPDIGIGALGTLGLDYKFSEVPINLSIDWRPQLAITPDVGLDWNSFGFSIRYIIK